MTRIISALCTALVTLCIMASSVAAETLVLGSVNSNVRKHLDRFAPMVDYLRTELAPAGITDVRVSILPTSDAMVNALREGEVHLYFDSPLVAMRVAQRSKSVPFLRRWKRKVATYHSVIIVPQDSPITSIAELTGRRIAFQDPDSTSGFLLPLALLADLDVPLRELSNRNVSPKSDEIGYVFTGDDKNTLLWLSKGWVDAGATDPRGFDVLENARPGGFRIIGRSIEVPRQVIVRTKDLDPALRDQIADVLRAMKDNERGRKAMKKFHRTNQFDDFPDGIEATFQPIYDVLGQLDTLGIR